MRIRSIAELVDFLDGDLSWRKRELTTTKFLIASSRHHQQEVMLRVGICLLYAHWEGFTKAATTAYVNYVALKGLRYCDLSPSMVALGLRAKLRTAEATNRVTVHSEVTSFLMSDMHENASLPWSDAVSTEGNLNSRVLQELLCLLDLSYTPYETKRVVIDERLLSPRNRIAHGERIPVEPTDYDDVYSEVITLLDLFRTDVENAAQIQRFRRSTAV